MNRTEAVEKIQRILGFRSDLNSQIISEINEALTRLEMGATKPWFLITLEGILSLSTVTNVFDLPSGFIEEYEEGSCQIQDLEGNWTEVIKNDLDELRRIYKSDTGLPEGYAIVGKSIAFFPWPDENYVVKLDYCRKDTALTEGNSTNQYLTHIPELVIGMAGRRIAQAIRDKEAVSFFKEMEADARVELYRQNESRKAANATYQIGGPE